MKKVSLFVWVIVAILALQVQAFATTKQDVLNAVSSPMTINGKQKNIPGGYVKDVADFLNRNDFSEAELQRAIGEVYSGKALWISTGKLNWSDMTPGEQQMIMNRFSAVAQTFEVSVGVDTATKTGSVTDKNDKTMKVELGKEEINPIKQTGMNLDFTPIYIVSALTVGFIVFAGIYVLRKKEYC